MRSSEKGEIVRRVMRVILDSRMEGKRRERQGDVAFVVDRIDPNALEAVRAEGTQVLPDLF